ncbi:ATP-binding protein (plasmid) [Streptomyces sp. NBC_01420]|uniref:ATP-binding protein n=1 Tax=Streptomyces sp. NBC_01420 TaxID=2903858 RepID=UPI002F90C2F0
MKPVPAAASGTPEPVRESPVLQEWLIDLPPTGSAGGLARIHTRTCLTVLGWDGSIGAATEITDRLVRNALVHGCPRTRQVMDIRLRLALTEGRQLLIEVSDSNPAFPDFGEAVLGRKGRGLWEVHRLGGSISWFLPHHANGKTVRALLGPAPCSGSSD